jgi:hypothetical protein
MKKVGFSKDTSYDIAILILDFQKGFMGTAASVEMGKSRNPVQRKNTIE